MQVRDNAVKDLLDQDQSTSSTGGTSGYIVVVVAPLQIKGLRMERL